MADLIDTDHDSHDNLRLRKHHQLIFNVAVIDTASGEELGQLTFKIPNNLQIPHSVIF
ncbi:MAG: hypothetical protein COB61_008185 [Thiotrichales bacterium]|nr:hypothetical protein [Thiotrichales bacterium]